MLLSRSGAGNRSRSRSRLDRLHNTALPLLIRLFSLLHSFPFSIIPPESSSICIVLVDIWCQQQVSSCDPLVLSLCSGLTVQPWPAPCSPLFPSLYLKRWSGAERRPDGAAHRRRGVATWWLQLGRGEPAYPSPDMSSYPGTMMGTSRSSSRRERYAMSFKRTVKQKFFFNFVID